MPSLALNVILLAAFAVAVWKGLQKRADRKMRGLFGPWPIRTVAPDAFDARFVTGPLGPRPATEIRFISNFRVAGGISDLETWILCNLARTAERIFEIGTCTGKTTYLLAANAPDDARIATLTLKPGQLGAYRAVAGDAANAQESAAAESCFTEFFYDGTPEKSKIEQLFGDSKTFDETQWHGLCDLVFVDGSHAQSYVESDSRKALKMVKPGGVIIWHDYLGPRRAPGVFEALNALSREIPLVHIAGTAFVAYRQEEREEDIKKAA